MLHKCVLSLFIVYIPGSPLPQGPKGPQSPNGLKGLKRLKSLKGLKSPKDLKGLKGLKVPTLGARAYGRMRNEELRRRQIRGCDTDNTFESLRIIIAIEEGHV